MAVGPTPALALVLVLALARILGLPPVLVLAQIQVLVQILVLVRTPDPALVLILDRILGRTLDQVPRRNPAPS